MSFIVWHISLSAISSKVIHIVANGMFSFFLRLSNVPLCVCMCVYIYGTSLSTHHEHFHILAVVNNAAMNTGKHLSLWTSIQNLGFLSVWHTEWVPSHMLQLTEESQAEVSSCLNHQFHFCINFPSSKMYYYLFFLDCPILVHVVGLVLQDHTFNAVS